MRKTPTETEVDIIKRVILGETYSEVSAKEGVAKSTINRVVEDVRRVIPDFDEIRGLLIRFKKCGLTMAEVEAALGLKERLDMLSLNFDDVEIGVVALEKLEESRLFASIAIDSLMSQYRTIVASNRYLAEKNGPLWLLDRALTTRSINLSCKVCQQTFPVRLETCECYQQLMMTRGVLQFVCPNCGYWGQYTPFEILSGFALCLLPRQTEISTPLEFDWK
jgi:hypothetical protein